MQTRTLGTAGLPVSALGLGCMGMSGTYGSAASRDPAEALATLALARELGVTFLDTAEVYGPYENESLLGRALAGGRDGWVVASKFGFRIGADGTIVGCDGTPQNARRACEASLARLGLETLDLYYLHRLDPAVPIEETVGAMADLVRAGKVRHLGLSEVSAGTLRRAVAVHPIAALQSEYSLFERGLEREVLPACRALGVGVVPFAPLGRGFLTGAARRGEEYGPGGDFRAELPRFQGENYDRNLALANALGRLAARRGCTPAQLALAWLLAQGEDIVPIPGTRKVERLDENAQAAFITLDPNEIARIDAVLDAHPVAGTRYPAEGMARVNV